MTVVLDASALLAVMHAEPGHEQVLEEWEDAVIGAVNRSEVVSKLVDHGMPAPEAISLLDDLGLDVEDFDASLADAAATLRLATRGKGLSLGDRACLALAAREGASILTADRAWGGLDIDLDIRLIR